MGSFSPEGETIKTEIMKTAAVKPSSHQISRINCVKGQAVATPATKGGFHIINSDANMRLSDPSISSPWVALTTVSVSAFKVAGFHYGA